MGIFKRAITSLMGAIRGQLDEATAYRLDVDAFMVQWETLRDEAPPWAIQPHHVAKAYHLQRLWETLQPPPELAEIHEAMRQYLRFACQAMEAGAKDDSETACRALEKAVQYSELAAKLYKVHE